MLGAAGASAQAPSVAVVRVETSGCHFPPRFPVGLGMPTFRSREEKPSWKWFKAEHMIISQHKTLQRIPLHSRLLSSCRTRSSPCTASAVETTLKSAHYAQQPFFIHGHKDICSSHELYLFNQWRPQYSYTDLF